MTPQRFTEILDKLDWTDTEAAKRLGVSRTTIWNYKRGFTSLREGTIKYLEILIMTKS